MIDRTLRPLGFMLLMLGFGLRLDTRWQALAWVLLAAGGAMAGWGVWLLGRRAASGGAFVRGEGEE